MKARRTRIAQMIADQTLKGGSSKKLSREIAAYLISEHRVSDLDSLLRDVQVDWAEAGQVEVVATSAFPLTTEIKKDIEAQVKRLYPAAKNIVINEVRNEDVIAGVRLQVANQQLDLSIESKLNKFKQLATQGA